MRIIEVFFSPTGGTEKVSDIIAKGLSESAVRVDITLNDNNCGIEISQDDLCIISVPSYGGRVPTVAAQRIMKLRGNGAKAVLVCVYGNRAYEDTLAELEDIVNNVGFNVVGAIAAIAEHSIARMYAAGRPDAADKDRLLDFSLKIKQKLESGDVSCPKLPGNRPYKKAEQVALSRKRIKNASCAVSVPRTAL